MINVIYADGQNANVQVKADRAHRPQARRSTPKRPTPSLDARVYLAGDEQLFGKLEAIGEDSLRLTTPWGDRARRPAGPRRRGLHGAARPQGVARVVRQAAQGPRGPRTCSWRGRRTARSWRSRASSRGRRGTSSRFRYQGKSRTLPLKQVEGLVLAARPEPEPPDRGAADLLAGRRPRRLGPLEDARGRDLEGRDRLGPGAQAPRRRGPRRPVPRGPDDLPLGPRAEQGRGDPVLRPPHRPGARTSTSPARRSRSTDQPIEQRPGGPLADGPDLRPRPAGTPRSRPLVGFDDVGQEEGAGRLPGLRRRQGTLRQPRPPRRRPAGQALPAGRGGRTAQARRRLRPRPGHRATA